MKLHALSIVTHVVYFTILFIRHFSQRLRVLRILVVSKLEQLAPYVYVKVGTLESLFGLEHIGLELARKNLPAVRVCVCVW